MNWFEKLLFRARTGAKIEYFGEDTKEYIIRFKNIYISVLESPDDYSVSWADTPTMFHVPVRDFWTATPPKPIKEVKD